MAALRSLAPTFLAVTLLGASAATARADDPGPLLRAVPWLVLGAHAGVAHPGGRLGGGSTSTTPRVGELAPTWVPLGLDAGARLAPRVYVGASFDWGPTSWQSGGGCVACGPGSAFEAVAEAQFLLAPRSTYDPWLSVASGWDVLHATFGQGEASATYSGPVVTRVRFGIDVRGHHVAVGPYLGLSVAEFTRHTLSPATPGVSASVGALAAHEWFTLGIRGTYGAL